MPTAAEHVEGLAKLSGGRGEPLTRITYKPGWRFHLVHDNGYGGMVLHIVAFLPDATNPKHPIIPVKLDARVTDTAKLSEENFLAFVQRQIQKLELHEVDEWLKVDGVHYQPPRH